ncbi:hypothetical protein EII18_03010 [Comamonadaceae bacterium OH3737_COT-264]|nr:hypothetical protein EII18_03010 [Comamonadaceae bacterium OH3737_COT-264]
MQTGSGFCGEFGRVEDGVKTTGFSLNCVALNLQEAMEKNQSSSLQRVYEAIVELHTMELQATRETVAEMTGMRLVTVDDSIKKLHNLGKIKRILRGVYAPVKQYPQTRIISTTIFPDGRFRLELANGELLVELTPKEAISVARAMRGIDTSAAAAAQTCQNMLELMEISAKLRKLEKQMDSLQCAGVA